MKIEGVEVRTVAPQVQRYSWSHDLPEQYMTNTFVRIRTDEGVEGLGGVSNYTSFSFDRYTAETLRHLTPLLLGADPLRREELMRRLRSRVFPVTPGLWRLLISHCGICWEKSQNFPSINCWEAPVTES